jgi:ferredoxin-NADP reductase/MOSC domain-containing protein YiiM/ferredoxin
MAKLVALNVGLPQDVSWQGRTVHTGVWKKAVSGPRMVRRLNIDGDGQGDLGGHGGEQRAVLVYQLDSYRHWARELQRDDFEYGQFGENFTVEGLPDDAVCIGDQYQIGEAVFEVTQPRVTCYRVGIRMAEPRMPALMVAHRRPGFYLRVITEGRVAPGQDIIKISTGPQQISVAEIDALLYLPGHPKDDLERALRIPALSPGWKGSLQSLLQQADGRAQGGGNTGLTAAAASPPPAWPGFRSLRVIDIQTESRDVFSLSLASVDGAPLPSWLPGQSITLRLQSSGDHPPLIRSYSLSNRPGSETFRISVKQEPHGAAGEYLRDQVRIGDSLDVAAPRGTFFLNESDGPVVLLSAGVGVTPVLSMLHALVQMHSTREVWWLHGVRDGSEHPFALEARTSLARLAHSRSEIAYSRPAVNDHQGVEYAIRGRLSADLINNLELPRDADAYLCGPVSFMADLRAALAGYGLDPARIHIETFGAEAALTPGIAASSSKLPHQPVGPPGRGPEVSFARSAITAQWASQYGSVLGLAEACDVPARWSCRTGVCHTCETALLSGAVSYDPEPLEPPADGNVLICSAQPTEAIIIDL